MTIKKGSKNDIFIETSKSKSSIFNDGGLILKIDPNDIIINKPGEYEYSDINVVSLELANDTFVGKPNFLRISSEGIDVGVVLSDIPSEKENLRDIANIHILIISTEASIDSIKRLLVFFEPQVLLLVDIKDAEQIQKDLNLLNTIKEKQVKFKNTDFRNEEGVILKSYILD